MENNTLCNRHSLGVNNHTKMYVTYTRIYGWSDYGGESSYQPGYRLENMVWMTLLVYDYIIPGENNMEHIARKRGCIKKGSDIDYEKCAACILDDFREGKIGTISLERP